MRTAIGSIVTAIAVLAVPGCSRDAAETESVVVYTSVDQVYAREVFERFTEESGIKVLPVFDTEAQKTTGLYRRLLAERDRPQADVFWNNEICRTIQLAKSGAAGDISGLIPADLPRRWVDPQGRWAGFSLRARVIVYNTRLIPNADAAPKSLSELTRPRWRGKAAMANPLFGTTATHVAALSEALGDKEAEELLRGLKNNGIRLVEGNSVVRDVVARGEAAVGLTDTDDVFAGMQDGLPIAFVLPDQDGMGTFAIPNTVMHVAGGPNPEAARAFIRFLLSPATERQLAFARARQIPVRTGIERPAELAGLSGLRAMSVDYNRIAERMPATMRLVEDIFLTDAKR